jgi:hypothetical protein
LHETAAITCRKVIKIKVNLHKDDDEFFEYFLKISYTAAMRDDNELSFTVLIRLND